MGGISSRSALGLAATAIATILFLIPLLISAILIKPAISAHSQFRTRMAALLLLFLGAAAGTRLVGCTIVSLRTTVSFCPLTVVLISGLEIIRPRMVIRVFRPVSALARPRCYRIQSMRPNPPPGIPSNAAKFRAIGPRKRVITSTVTGGLVAITYAQIAKVLERIPDTTISASLPSCGSKTYAPWDLFWPGRCLRVTSNASWMEKATSRSLGHICDRSPNAGVVARFHDGTVSIACCSRPSYFRRIWVGHVFP